MLQQKINTMIRQYSALPEFRGYKSKTILNLTLRGGRYSLKVNRWSADEEAELIPLLVKLGMKPLGSVVLQNLDNGIDDVVVPPNCKTFIHKNRWDCEILILYNPNNANYKMILEKYKGDTAKMLIELCDETMYIRDIGILYGYDDEFN